MIKDYFTYEKCKLKFFNWKITFWENKILNLFFENKNLKNKLKIFYIIYFLHIKYSINNLLMIFNHIFYSFSKLILSKKKISNKKISFFLFKLRIKSSSIWLYYILYQIIYDVIFFSHHNESILKILMLFPFFLKCNFIIMQDKIKVLIQNIFWIY